MNARDLGITYEVRKQKCSNSSEIQALPGFKGLTASGFEVTPEVEFTKLPSGVRYRDLELNTEGVPCQVSTDTRHLLAAAVLSSADPRACKRQNPLRVLLWLRFEGPPEQDGDVAAVHFVGKYLNGREFESTRQNFGTAVRFVVGQTGTQLRGSHPVPGGAVLNCV